MDRIGFGQSIMRADQLHPLIAPALNPCMKYRDRNANIRNSGNTIKDDPAIASPHRMSNEPTIEAIPIEFMEYDRDKRLILINRAARLSQRWTGEAVGKTERELLEESLRDKRGNTAFDLAANDSVRATLAAR